MERYTILIVDDDPDQLKLLTGNLIGNNHDYQLLIATNGKSGYDIAVRNNPDLILMDWEMPVVNGIEAIRMIKADERTKSTPIIMITGTQGETEKLKEAMEAGAIDFINKPYNAVELMARIMTQINNLEIHRRSLAQQELIGRQEKEILSKEKTILEQELEIQTRQLTMNALNMVRQSELLQSVITGLQKVIPYTSAEGRSIMNSIIFELRDTNNEHLWHEFELSFEKVHSGFYNKLTSAIPDISTREKRLCAFMRMNMTTKEMSAITFQTP